jgi:hypothetical protein
VAKTHDANERFCQIHNRSTEVGICEIRYGFLCINRESYAAKTKLFPLENTSFSGGCEIYPWSPSWQLTFFCPECRQAQAAWIKDRQKNRSDHGSPRFE